MGFRNCDLIPPLLTYSTFLLPLEYNEYAQTINYICAEIKFLGLTNN